MGRPSNWQSKREEVEANGQSQFVTTLDGELAIRFIDDAERQGKTATDLIAEIIALHYAKPPGVVNTILAHICGRTGQNRVQVMSELLYQAGVARLKELNAIEDLGPAPRVNSQEQNFDSSVTQRSDS